MKRTILNNIVSAFVVATDPDAIMFNEEQHLAISEAYAAGYAVYWDGKSLSLETDFEKVASMHKEFLAAWEKSDFKNKLDKKSKEKDESESVEDRVKKAFAK